VAPALDGHTARGHHRRVAKVLALLVLVAMSGCYPHGPGSCKSTDTNCWPCPTAGTTNPACAPPLTDATKHPDAGATP
jgi:hypothetical protein